MKEDENVEEQERQEDQTEQENQESQEDQVYQKDHPLLQTNCEQPVEAILQPLCASACLSVRAPEWSCQRLHSLTSAGCGRHGDRRPTLAEELES